MSDFAIVTDTAAELLEELSVKLDIHMIPMEFTMSGVSYQHDAGYRQMDAKTFYRQSWPGGRMCCFWSFPPACPAPIKIASWPQKSCVPSFQTGSSMW